MKSYEDDLVDKSKKKVKKVGEKPTVHSLLILDSSASMSGGKWNAAVEGAKVELAELSKDKDVNFTFSMCIFSESILFPFWKVDKPTSFDKRCLYQSTALHDAVGDSILKMEIEEGEKVLVKIWTDGEENRSRRRTASEIAKLIKDREKTEDWTFTFLGTKWDVAECVKLYGIDKSNTVTHDNTERGYRMATESTLAATRQYSKRVSKGEKVTRGFYND